MMLRYARAPLTVLLIFYLLHLTLVVRGFAHLSLGQGLFFSLLPLAGPFASFFYLIQLKSGLATLSVLLWSACLIFGMCAYRIFKTRWSKWLAVVAAILWCLSGFFGLYALAT